MRFIVKVIQLLSPHGMRETMQWSLLHGSSDDTDDAEDHHDAIMSGADPWIPAQWAGFSDTLRHRHAGPGLLHPAHHTSYNNFIHQQKS